MGLIHVHTAYIYSFLLSKFSRYFNSRYIFHLSAMALWNLLVLIQFESSTGILKVTSEGCFQGNDWKPDAICETGWQFRPQHVGVDICTRSRAVGPTAVRFVYSHTYLSRCSLLTIAWNTTISKPRTQPCSATLI